MTARLIAVYLAALIPSIILHEISHGWVALAYGDSTAKRAGRLTLNPIAHVDPFGTLILPAILVFSGVGAFGWAKPVPVNPRALRDPRRHSLLVSLAGPGTNLVLAGLSVLVLRFVIPPEEVAAALLFLGRLPVDASLGVAFLCTLGITNVILAVFNLLPIPPLDGSAILERFMPTTWWPGYLRFRQYSMGLLLLLVLVLPGVLGQILTPAVEVWQRLVL